MPLTQHSVEIYARSRYEQRDEKEATGLALCLQPARRPRWGLCGDILYYLIMKHKKKEQDKYASDCAQLGALSVYLMYELGV